MTACIRLAAVVDVTSVTRCSALQDYVTCPPRALSFCFFQLDNGHYSYKLNDFTYYVTRVRRDEMIDRMMGEDLVRNSHRQISHLVKCVVSSSAPIYRVLVIAISN